jgi:hypothetical protein
MSDCIRDQVVERLTQPLGIAFHHETRLDLRDNRCAGYGRGLGSVDGKPAHVENLWSKRRRRGIDEEPLEACNGCDRELDEAFPRHVIGSRVRLRYRGKGRHGASHLVRE